MKKTRGITIITKPLTMSNSVKKMIESARGGIGSSSSSRDIGMTRCNDAIDWNIRYNFREEFLPGDIGFYDNVEELINSPIKTGFILKNKRTVDRYYNLFRNLATLFGLEVPNDLLTKHLNDDEKNRNIIHSNTKSSLGVDITDTNIIYDFAVNYVSPHADPYLILEKILVMLHVKESLIQKMERGELIKLIDARKDEVAQLLRYDY